MGPRYRWMAGYRHTERVEAEMSHKLSREEKRVTALVRRRMRERYQRKKTKSHQ